VGIFPDGASPYGVLDLSGNVWEWTRSKYQPYPYRPDDGREAMAGDDRRALRGGSWYFNRHFARAASRDYYLPGPRNHFVGLRLVLARRPPSHPDR
jgi:formylglycine-generating enzyme required for sulfatase activity